MRTIIAGSRNVEEYYELLFAIKESGFEITSVISGGARGVDRLGERYANEHDLPLLRIYPDWNTYGKAAGHIRNAEMAEMAEAVLVLWDGVSKGTENMILNAKRKNLKTYIHMV